MAAKKSGGTGARLKAKNQAMAAAMKAHGIERNIARCPVCHSITSLGRLAHHIASCKG